MTSPFRVRDALFRGLGKAAERLGEPYDLLRPRGAEDPLATANRVMRLFVLLDEVPVTSPLVRGSQVVRASFDGISARVGDYLRGPRGALFIADLPGRRRPSCVLTNVVVDICRSDGPALAGLNKYGGVTTESLLYVLRRWPMRAQLSTSTARSTLPADRGRSSWLFWAPPTPVDILPADIILSGTGDKYVVSALERVHSGWRIEAHGTEV